LKNKKKGKKWTEGLWGGSYLVKLESYGSERGGLGRDKKKGALPRTKGKY